MWPWGSAGGLRPPSFTVKSTRAAGVHLGILVVLRRQSSRAGFSAVSPLWEMDPRPDLVLSSSFVSVQMPPLVFP